MRHSLLALLFMLVFFADTTLVQAQQDDYVLVFSDEFSQANGSPPNASVWSCPPRGNAIWSRWISNHSKVVYIKNGCLVCRAIPNKYERTDTAKMLTGAVYSKDKFEFQYGKVEVRMRTNQLKGNFPAAWMGKTHKQDPKTYGEIDIVEVFGDERSSNHCIHSQYTVSTLQHGLKNTFRNPIDVSKWHVYGIEWTPTYVLWKVDGKTVGYFEKAKDEESLMKHQWTFDYPFFLLLNQSVGDGSFERLQYPNVKRVYETRFDWIRVYQKRH